MIDVASSHSENFQIAYKSVIKERTQQCTFHDDPDNYQISVYLQDFSYINTERSRKKFFVLLKTIKKEIHEYISLPNLFENSKTFEHLIKIFDSYTLNIIEGEIGDWTNPKTYLDQGRFLRDVNTQLSEYHLNLAARVNLLLLTQFEKNDKTFLFLKKDEPIKENEKRRRSSKYMV